MLVTKINFVTGDLPIQWKRYPRDIEFISFVSKNVTIKIDSEQQKRQQRQQQQQKCHRTKLDVYGIWLVCRLPRICYFWLKLMSVFFHAARLSAAIALYFVPYLSICLIFSVVLFPSIPSPFRILYLEQCHWRSSMFIIFLVGFFFLFLLSTMPT